MSEESRNSHDDQARRRDVTDLGVWEAEMPSLETAYIEIDEWQYPDPGSNVVQQGYDVFNNNPHTTATGDIHSEAHRRLFLRDKFAFFNFLLGSLEPTDPDIPPDTVMDAERRVRIPDKVRASWEAHFGDETIAYLARIAHLPLDTVHGQWYADFPEFLAWARAVRKLSEAVSTAQLEELLRARSPICFEEERFLGSQLEGRALDQRRSLLPPSGASDIVWILQDRLVSELGDRPISAESVVASLLTIVRDHHGLRVVDYLQAARSRDLEVDHFATTFEVSIGELQESEPRYGLADGITGSALLIDLDALHPWYGTNNLTVDQRQSITHGRFWQVAYGPAYAFLVLPVYGRGRPIGLLRAVDPPLPREAKSGGAGTWPLEMRLALRRVADYISLILPLVTAVVQDKATHSRVVEEAIRREPNVLAWLDRDLLVNLIEASLRVVDSRTESDSQNTAFVVAEDDVTLKAVIAMARQSTLVNPVEQSGVIADAGGNWSRLLRRVKGTTSAFAVAPRLSDAGVLRYEAILEEPDLGWPSLAKVPAVQRLGIIEVNSDRKVISIRDTGTWNADFYLFEREGAWTVRKASALSNVVRELLDSEPAAFTTLLLQTLTDKIVPYSYLSHGGMFVFAEASESDLMWKKNEGHEEVNKLLVSSMSFEHFVALAQQDGAVWFALDGATLASEMKVADDGQHIDNPAGRGTRWRAGVIAARRLKRGAVVVVSQNRDIAVRASGDRYHSF